MVGKVKQKNQEKNNMKLYKYKEFNEQVLEEGIFGFSFADKAQNNILYAVLNAMFPDAEVIPADKNEYNEVTVKLDGVTTKKQLDAVASTVRDELKAKIKEDKKNSYKKIKPENDTTGKITEDDVDNMFTTFNSNDVK